MRQLIIFIILVSFILFSCSNQYEVYKSHYAFKSIDGKPDYSDLNYWAAHPWKWNPADSIPKSLRAELKDSSVDVFFLHPTTYTIKSKTIKLNAPVDDPYLNAKTDYTTILYQASVFNQQCRIFAPRYRQANFSVFFIQDKEKTDSIFELAYEDLKTAFKYYLEHWNKGRPIIIAGHSQGAMMAERLLKDFFEDKPLQNQLVAAYVPGWVVPKKYFTSLKMCSDSLQTGCICSWRTFRKGYIPSYLRTENENSLITNPLTWTTDNKYAPRSMNEGSVLYKFNKIYRKTTDAQINNGLLWVKQPKFPFSRFYFRKNYHIGDINLFYMNLRENIRQRIISYLKH